MLVFFATALANPQFNGSWTLDRQASEPIGPILQAQGLSWIERTLAESGSPTHTIEWSPEKALVYVQSGWYRRTDELPLDGAPRRVTYTRIGDVDVSSTMEAGVLHTTAGLTLRDGRPGTLESLRELVDENTLRLTMRFTSPEGETMEAERIFRRQ